MLFVSCSAGRFLAAAESQSGQDPPGISASSHRGSVTLPNLTNAVQFRLYTNSSPDSPHLFNTIEIEGYGETLLGSPSGNDFKRLLRTLPSSASLHNLLVNGAGPNLAAAGGMTVIEQSAGPDWVYIALDAGAAYRDRLKQFKRGILFVEPDLFVLYDHLVATAPSDFQMLLHPPAGARVDGVWGDLRLELPRAGITIDAPAGRNRPRNWERTESAADGILTNTVTIRLGPTNQLDQLDLLTVFAIHRAGERRDLAFKLLESTSAIGARIHRAGLPTLVAFRTDPGAGKANLTGFEFSGPVGVSVYKPKTPKDQPGRH